MTWGTGYVIGIGLALIFWFFLIRPVDKKYYDKKLRIIQKNIKQKEKVEQNQQKECADTER
ncbi:hypothetical protein [Sessilibacter corallicola]|uniref:hypothetical protein n=1 Tax=Sessilibacter corallicola TaxID=2904075 RepID=UPI001E5B47E4|nr:hypothetical protein [Sessilibacter corallicola]MCE2029457.1 hypothetical protein [Sessilibacter corallicola]